MAAYGAAISLKNTIRCLLQSSRISLVPPSPQVIQPTYDAMVRLQKVLLKLEDTGYTKIRTKVNYLDERIKEVVWEFEDLLESHVYEQILPRVETGRDHFSFPVDLQSLRKSVDCFVEKVAVMEAEFDIELLSMPEEEGEPLSSRIDFGGIDSNMVGLSGEFEEVRAYLCAEDDMSWWLPVIGMAGVGKTTFAKKLFDDPLVKSHFELRAWVKVGRKCEFHEMVQCILAQVDPNAHIQMLTQGDDGDDEKLVGLLQESLKDKKCLIVLDDVWKWDTRVMDTLLEENVRILLTSRQNIKECPTKGTLRLLTNKESKKLLGEKMFGKEGFPPHLDELGEKIAKKCEGLPLMIVTVAELLSKEETTTENWTEVAEKQHNSVFVDAYDQIAEVLYPSYNYLPQNLKMLFLYLGAFPPYTDIRPHIVFNMLSSEGFLESFGSQILDDFMNGETSNFHLYEWVVHLAFRYFLVLFSVTLDYWFSKKMFRVHSCWQHFCKKEATRIKFLHVLQSYDDVVKDQRRLCAQHMSLFSLKEVCEKIKNDCASNVRSLLCLGQYHEYAMPIHAMDFRLLKVLEAGSVRFYRFPLEIFKLICLKYLCLTYNKEIPVSISNLFHLQFLTIYKHMNIIKLGALSCMPVEVWDMKELQHIEVWGKDLPTPDSVAALDRLYALIGVSEKSCTREILQRIPNLKKLGIVVQLQPYDEDDDRNLLSNLGFISEELQKLDTLQFTVKYPDIKRECMVPLSMFSSSLTMLNLSGLGCPWKYMNDIGTLLPNLSNLKLQNYAFRGPEWDIGSACFLKLETVIIMDTNLVRLRTMHGSLPRLKLLSLHHCYKLQQLDWTRGPSMFTTTIELVECNPLAIASAYQLRPESVFKIHWYSSF
ncbi:putative late blight resistance protein homolog R1B-12 [Salvia hispanica]|uniref:putative late blight resistance protein homolog R1B-12 n=1 Tax=Salvia hispanica TaxID=49212 RepID=UPI0020096D60|nr:putative late blight resistance protein homolog R1B-12 [Salvia hispanica]